MSDSGTPRIAAHQASPSITTPGAYSNSCPSRQWCHPTNSSSVVPFFSRLQSFPESGSLQMSQFFTSGGQSIGDSASTSVLPTNIQGWFSLGLTGLFSLLSKGLSRVFNTTVWKHQFLSAQPFYSTALKNATTSTFQLCEVTPIVQASVPSFRK